MEDSKVDVSQEHSSHDGEAEERGCDVSDVPSSVLSKLQPQETILYNSNEHEPPQLKALRLEDSTDSDGSQELVLYSSNGRRLSDPGTIIGLDTQGNQVFQDDKGRRFLILNGRRTTVEENEELFDKDGEEIREPRRFVGHDRHMNGIFMDGRGSVFLLRGDGGRRRPKSASIAPIEAQFLARTSRGNMLYQTENGDVYLVRNREVDDRDEVTAYVADVLLNAVLPSFYMRIVDGILKHEMDAM